MIHTLRYLLSELWAGVGGLNSTVPVPALPQLLTCISAPPASEKKTSFSGSPDELFSLTKSYIAFKYLKETNCTTSWYLSFLK